MISFRLRVLFVVLVVSLILGCEKRNDATAKITGTVWYGSSPAPGTTLTLRSREINKTLVTDGSGRFSFEELMRGDYTIEAAANTTLGVATQSLTVQINKFGETIQRDIYLNNPSYPGGTSGPGGGSCPYIYIINETENVFNGDVFAGCIYPNLQRDDYLPLKGIRNTNHVQIKIANELRERQYTDLAELWVVRHPAGTQVLVDRSGKLRTVSSPISPNHAISTGGRNLLSSVKTPDGRKFGFDETATESDSWLHKYYRLFLPPPVKSSIELSFPRNPANGTDDAKLVLRAKNTDWSERMFKELVASFGNYYDTWRLKQHVRPSEELIRQRKEEAVVMMVYVHDGKDWVFADYVDMVGAVNLRDVVLPLHLPPNLKEVKIKLESAFRFWELDYVAMDFTQDLNLRVETVKATELSNNGVSADAKALRDSDKKYLAHEHTGDQALAGFDANQPIGSAGETVFLHCRGYYEPMTNFNYGPNWLALLKFSRPGAFARHCYERSQTLALANVSH